MTDVLAKWISQPSELELERIARKIALASIELVEKRLNTSWFQKSTSEARGYLRARSRRIVMEQAHEVIGPLSEYSASQESSIATRAIEIAASRLLRQPPGESPTMQVKKSA